MGNFDYLNSSLNTNNSTYSLGTNSSFSSLSFDRNPNQQNCNFREQLHRPQQVQVMNVQNSVRNVNLNQNLNQSLNQSLVNQSLVNQSLNQSLNQNIVNQSLNQNLINQKSNQTHQNTNQLNQRSNTSLGLNSNFPQMNINPNHLQKEPISWVEIIDIASDRHMYANINTGEVKWNPP